MSRMVHEKAYADYMEKCHEEIDNARTAIYVCSRNLSEEKETKNG